MEAELIKQLDRIATALETIAIAVAHENGTNDCCPIQESLDRLNGKLEAEDGANIADVLKRELHLIYVEMPSP